MPDSSQILAKNAPADALAQAHARLLQATDLQFSFPSYVAPKRPEWLEAFARFLKSIGPYLLDLFWVMLAAAALAALYYIGREVLRRRGWWKPEPEKASQSWPQWRPTPEQARLLLADADRLAAEGQYREAAHLLLLRSIQDIDDRRPQLVRPALTTREIARLDNLPETARTCFTEIARTVERGLFAGHAVSAEDFAHCRSAYEQFALPQLWLQGLAA